MRPELLIENTPEGWIAANKVLFRVTETLDNSAPFPPSYRIGTGVDGRHAMVRSCDKHVIKTRCGFLFAVQNIRKRRVE